jgi:hypothetical protein
MVSGSFASLPDRQITFVPPLPEREASACESGRMKKESRQAGFFAPKRRLPDFPGPAGRRTPWGSQCFLLDRLQIVREGHLLPDQTFDRKQLDDLVLMPNGKLVVLGYHLSQDRTSGHLRTNVGGGQIDIDTAIATHMAQIHLPIQWSQPGIRVNPLWQGW